MQDTTHRPSSTASGSVQIVRGRSPRTDTGDKTAVLTQIVRHLIRIEDDRDVEEREDHDQRQEDQFVIRIAAVKLLKESVRPSTMSNPDSSGSAGNAENRVCGIAEHRRCKDHGDNAAHVDLQRQARFLSAKCLVTDPRLA